MASHLIQKVLTEAGTLTARPAAFLVLAAYVALWLVFDRESFDWHGMATVATWAMTLLIQRAEHRDTQAIHAKLDELLRTHDAARDELMNLDDKEPEEVEKHRAREKRDHPA